MSATESINRETSEEEVEDEVDELEEAELSVGGIQTRMQNVGGTVVTVITRNVKVNIMGKIKNENPNNHSGGILATHRVPGR